MEGPLDPWRQRYP